MGKFAERLKELREDSGLTQTQLAGKIDVSQAAIAKWERGQRSPSIEYIIILCNFFKVSSDYLLGLVDY